jgi:hypothetical protein
VRGGGALVKERRRAQFASWSDDGRRTCGRFRAVDHGSDGAALQRCPSGQIRVLSMCAGQGHDLIDVLDGHPRRGDVHARLVEFDARNVSAARDFAMAADLRRVEILRADASLTDVYEGILPANPPTVVGGASPARPAFSSSRLNARQRTDNFSLYSLSLSRTARACALAAGGGPLAQSSR